MFKGKKDDLDELEYCVSCGKAIEISEKGFPNHHCSKKHIGAQESANTRAEEPLVRKNTYSRRIKDGFAMAHLSCYDVRDDWDFR